MDSQPKCTNLNENERAYRIALRLSCSHERLSIVYEAIVDRERPIAEKEIKLIRADLLLILKSLEDDDF